MSAVSCPKCSRLVTLPERNDAEAWVRCPLCREEYPLQAAIDALPPVLEVIPAPVDAVSLPPAAWPAAAPKVHPPALPPPATGKPIPIPIAVSVQTDAQRELIDEPQTQLPKLSESPPNPAPQPRTAPDKPHPSARPPALPTQPAALQTQSTASADESWMSEPIGGQSDRSRRRRRKSNPVREFLKIVIGGIIGLALGNAVLFWGLKIDLFNMAKHLPAFMVPEKLTPKGEPTTGIISSADSRMNVEARPIAGPRARFLG